MYVYLPSAGQVEYVDLMKGMDGRPNGCAYVLFTSPLDAQEAISMFCLKALLLFGTFYALHQLVPHSL